MSFYRTKIIKSTRPILHVAGFFLALGMGTAIGMHVTIENIARHDLLKETQLNKPASPWALSLGWRLVWEPTPENLTPNHLRKKAEAKSLIAFDSGVIGPLSGIKKFDWQAEKDIPRAQRTLREAFIAKLGRKLDYVDNPSVKVHSTQNLTGGVRRI